MAAAASSQGTPRDLVVDLLTSAALAARCFRDGEPLLTWRAIDARWARLARAVSAAPSYPPEDWDADCWRALVAAAQLAAQVPRNWRGRTVPLLAAVLEISLHLDAAERAAAAGLPDSDLPFYLRD